MKKLTPAQHVHDRQQLEAYIAKKRKECATERAVRFIDRDLWKLIK